MREEQALGPRRLEGGDGLVEGEVTARLAVELATEEGRFTDEQIGIACSFDKLVGRRRVSRVRDHGAVPLDAEGVGLEPVVRDAGRRHLELAGEERRAGSYSARRKVRSNMSGKPRRVPSSSRNFAPPGCTQSCGFGISRFDAR